MRTLFLQCLIALLCLTLPAVAKSSFAGTWEGSMNDQPALKLTIEDTDGKLAGTMAFYFQRRGEDGKFHVVPNGDAAGAIISPQVEGKILTFEVQHHKKHGTDGRERGPIAPSGRSKVW